jgi:hypothetical protein
MVQVENASSSRSRSFVAGTAISVAIYFPCTSLAEWIARRQGFPILAQIPISVAILLILCQAIAWSAAAVGWAGFRSAEVRGGARRSRAERKFHRFHRRYEALANTEPSNSTKHEPRLHSQTNRLVARTSPTDYSK